MVEFSRAKKAEQRIAHRSSRDLQAEIARVPLRDAGSLEEQEQFPQLRATIKDMAIKAGRRRHANYNSEELGITQLAFSNGRRRLKFTTSESVTTTFSFSGDRTFPTISSIIQRSWFGLGPREVTIRSGQRMVFFGRQ